MNKIYLVIIAMFNEEENSIVNICSTKEKAIELKEQYTKNCKCSGYDSEYYIQEVILDPNEEILWDCYKNSKYFKR